MTEFDAPRNTYAVTRFHTQLHLHDVFDQFFLLLRDLATQSALRASPPPGPLSSGSRSRHGWIFRNTSRFTRCASVFLEQDRCKLPHLISCRFDESNCMSYSCELRQDPKEQKKLIIPSASVRLTDLGFAALSRPMIPTTW